MIQPHSIRSEIAYGRKLMKAGLTGVRSGQDAARAQRPLSSLAAEAAQQSLLLAVIGACVGLIPSFTNRRNRLANALALGAAGSAVGFLAGFGWKTRKVTASVAQSTARELRKARDEHWLELNPIDYA